MTFYVSEIFFGDEKIAKRRHFRDADSMNNKIIENWNSIITPDDKVYILGGVGEFEFLLSLNGEKTLMMSDYEDEFYKRYIRSVTTEIDDPYNKEMFEVYLKNMFYVENTVFGKLLTRKDYSGNLVRLQVAGGRGDRSQDPRLTIYGAIGDYQRMTHKGINSNILVNGMFPLSEIEAEDIKKHLDKQI